MQTGCPPQFSAAIICYNEEKHIANCLRSLSFCEQIAVVDSGSQDRTVEIAREFPNVEIAVRPFDNFINQKNHALAMCKHEWVISLDADEILTDKLITEIHQLPFTLDGYYISRRTFIGSKEIKYGNWNPDYQLRLFRRSVSRWGGTNPHERVIVEGETGKLNQRMLHYSYSTRQDLINRREQYLRMAVKHMADTGKKANWLTPYGHCVANFVKSYFLKAGFLDGYDGLYIAQATAWGSYLKYTMSLQQNIPSKAKA